MDIVITAWDGGKIVGIARALTDYAYCCYLSDLAVDTDYYPKVGFDRTDKAFVIARKKQSGCSRRSPIDIHLKTNRSVSL